MKKIIEKKLKNVTFQYGEDIKQLTIKQNGITDIAILTTIEMFSLFRFLIRVSQRLSRKHRKIKEGGKK